MRASVAARLLGLLPVAALLALDPRGSAPFTPAKWMLVPALVLAGGALAVRGRGGDVAVVRRVGAAWLVFLVVVAVAAAVGLDPLYAWTGTSERHFGAITWALCAIAFTAGQLLEVPGRALVGRAAAAGGAVAGLWVTAEVLGWRPIDLAGAGDRPVGPLGSSAYLGAAAALVLPVAVGLAVGNRGRTRAGWSAAAAAVLVALVASGARAAWMGALAAGVVALAVRRPSGVSARRVARAVGAAAVAAVALAAATGVAGRVTDAVRDRNGGVRGRVDEWRVAARVVAHHPLTGVGPEGYRIDVGRHVDDRYEQVHGRAVLPDRAHAALLDVAATTGLPGLGAYVALLLFAGRFVVRAIRRAPPELAGIAAGLVAYGAQSLVLFPIAELEPVAWLLAGLVVTGVARPEEVVRVRVPRAVPALAAAVAVVAFVAGALDVAADREARTILGRVAAGDTAIPTGRLVRLRPDSVRYRLVAAQAAAAGGGVRDLSAAVRHTGHALEVSPLDPAAGREHGRLLLDLARRTGAAADVGRARRALEGVLARDPRNAEVLLRVGLARQLDGDDAGAERAWRRAERLAPSSAAASTNLALAYARAGRWDDARAAARRALARDPNDDRAAGVLRVADGT